MKKNICLFSVLISVLLMAFSVVYTAEQPVETIQRIADNTTRTVADGMAPYVGFYTGSGNMSGCSVRPFPGWSAGLGAGASINTKLFSSFGEFGNLSGLSFGDLDSISSSISRIAAVVPLVPMPYDTLYGKIAIPSLPADVGFRIGILPNVSISAGAASIGLGAFHMGGEFRYTIVQSEGGVFRLDARGSLDYDGGTIHVNAATNQEINVTGIVAGTNDIVINFAYSWSGISAGARLQGGIYSKDIGGVWLGIGPNLNLGQVSSVMTFDVTARPNQIGILEERSQITGKAAASYSPIDIRGYFGFQLACVSLAAEYGILSQALAVSIYPVILQF